MKDSWRPTIAKDMQIWWVPYRQRLECPHKVQALRTAILKTGTHHRGILAPKGWDHQTVDLYSPGTYGSPGSEVCELCCVKDDPTGTRESSTAGTSWYTWLGREARRISKPPVPCKPVAVTFFETSIVLNPQRFYNVLLLGQVNRTDRLNSAKRNSG